MVKVLRGGNIGEAPFFFKSDGVFISGDLVKPELYLRKNCMIAPAVSSPDGKIALIGKDYSDVFTACSSSSFAESRNPFTSRLFRFPCSQLLSSFTVPFQRMEYLAGCSSHSFRIFIASQAARHARSSPVLSVAHSPVIRLVITARMEALRISCRYPTTIRVDIGHSGLPQIFNQVLGTRRPETIFTDFAPLPDVE